MVFGAPHPQDAERKSSLHLVGLWSINVCWLLAQTVAVSEKHDALVLSLSANVWLNPLAPSGGLPHSLKEAPWSPLNIRSVVLSHNRLNSFRSLVSVVEGDGGDVVVKDVGLDDAVEDVAADEAEFAVDGGGCAADVSPRLAGVVREGGVGVLEEGNRDCR